MAAVTHHIALRVDDLDRAARFYIDVLDGHYLTLPKEASGDLAETVMGGPPGTTFLACRLGFDEGCIELFQFTGDAAPAWAKTPTRARVPHFGVLVRDIPETLRRIEAAGGAQLWPEVEHWGPASTMYASDPDGNVFELADMNLRDLVGVLLELFPDTDPKRRAEPGTTASPAG